MLLRFILISKPSLLIVSLVLSTSQQSTIRIMSDNANPNQKTYHKKATGVALNTVKKHSKDHELKLYGSCFW